MSDPSPPKADAQANTQYQRLITVVGTYVDNIHELLTRRQARFPILPMPYAPDPDTRLKLDIAVREPTVAEISKLIGMAPWKHDASYELKLGMAVNIQAELLRRDALGPPIDLAPLPPTKPSLMPVLDFNQTITHIQEFLGVVTKREVALGPMSILHASATDPTRHLRAPADTKARLAELTPQIQVYAELLEDGPDHHFPTDTRDECRSTITKAEHLLQTARLAQARRAITATTFNASDLHRAVWTDRVQQLWASANPDEALQRAGESLVSHVQAKLNKKSKAYDLIMAPFAVDEKHQSGKLVLPDFDVGTETWISAHQGANGLSRACYQLVRNVNTHHENNNVASEALEYLGMLSALARLVDRATLVTQDTFTPSDG